MKSKEHFQRAGADYWQADLPEFPNGYSAGKRFWIFDQSSPYYRRHLLLHEGVHSFMTMLVGPPGPPWYMEGMAELLATHHWQDGKLTVGWFPASSREVLQLGRIEIIQDAPAAGHVRDLEADVSTCAGRLRSIATPMAGLGAWPRFSTATRGIASVFGGLPALLSSGDFEQRISPPLRRRLGPSSQTEWLAFVASVDYGYDFQRMAIDFRPAKPLERRRRAGEDRGRSRLAIEWSAARSRQNVRAVGQRPLSGGQIERRFGGASREA